MDKSWIHESNRLSTNYLQGILNFLQFPLKSSKDGKLPCPCIKCVNALRFGQDVVMDHLIKHGLCMSYMHWYCHGESLSTTIEGDHFNNLNLNYGQSSSGVQVRIQQFIEDMVIGHANIGDKGFNSEMVEHFDCGNDQNIEIDGKELNKEAQKFYGFLKKTNEVLFEGSKKHSKLSFILDLFHKKCLNGWSNKSFKDLLGTLRETLLNGEKLPKSCYEVKKLIEWGKGIKNELGFTLVNLSKLIHARVHLHDEPFVFASQMQKVFYVQDALQSDWNVVVRTKSHDLYEMGEELSLESNFRLPINGGDIIGSSNAEFEEDNWTRNDIDDIIVDIEEGAKKVDYALEEE
ncbi:hypothetical protein GH714_014831 [Hevea brasiliensis]|uniref:Transposase-associated domain-containing protein n=1 Tax=Hevea brasiliensis TaxID=3981 RepID=A0A6A6MXS2_HEVBR|nr:hypothetical protein GH714_014831 [Hevea brasiliensis]